MKDHESHVIIGIGSDQKEIEIKVNNEDVWDLLEINRTYTLVFEKTNDESQILVDVIVDKSN